MARRVAQRLEGGVLEGRGGRGRSKGRGEGGRVRGIQVSLDRLDGGGGGRGRGGERRDGVHVGRRAVWVALERGKLLSDYVHLGCGKR